MIIFRSVGFADWLWNLKDIQNSRQNRSKNKLIRENAVTWAYGSFSLRDMGSYHHALERKRNFVSPRDHVISSIYQIPWTIVLKKKVQVAKFCRHR